MKGNERKRMERRWKLSQNRNKGKWNARKRKETK
jgi:hypothetical protein